MARDNLAAALQLADVGWRVMPLHSPEDGKCDCHRPQCPSPAKHPRITDWTNTASDALDQITRWWGMWPQANVGVLTGPPSGLVVVDIDPRHGGDETIRGWVEEYGLLPWVPQVSTGGGGVHLYLKHPGGKVLSRTIAPGIDIKADGGQVVAPPSIHITGGSYSWEADFEPWQAAPGDIPDWLLDKMHDASHDGAFEGAGTGLLPEVIPDGERNSWLASWAGTMRRRGASQSVMFKSLLAVNETCEHPLSHNEVAQIAASIARYTPQVDAPVIIDTGGDGQPRRAPTQARTLRFSELEHQEFPPRQMAVPGLMPVGLALLAGRLKLGKSWLMLGVSMAIAQGGIALGQYPVEDGDVLYIAYEDDERRIQKRGKDLLLPGWPGRLEIAPSGWWPQRDAGGLEAISTWLKAHPEARMVVIDTLQRFRGGGMGEKESNAYAADYQVSAEIQELAMRHEVVIVAIHHYRKSLSEVDWVDQISGTNGIAGAADVLMGFERERGSADAILKAVGRDLEEDLEMAMIFDAGRYGWCITGSAEELRLTIEAREFREALTELGHGGPVHYRQLAESLGKKRNSVLKMARRLSERGYLESIGGGMYKAVTAVTADSKPVTETVNPVTGLDSKAVTGAVLPVTGDSDRSVTAPLSPLFEPENAPGDSGDSHSVLDTYRERLRRSRQNISDE